MGQTRLNVDRPLEQHEDVCRLLHTYWGSGHHLGLWTPQRIKLKPIDVLGFLFGKGPITKYFAVLDLKRKLRSGELHKGNDGDTLLACNDSHSRQVIPTKGSLRLTDFGGEVDYHQSN